MEEAAKPKEANKIQTFVFFDLESTGVHRSKPRIVELSMIAVSRTHLLEMKDSATVDSMPPGAGEQTSSSHTTARHTTSCNSECTDVHRKNAVPKLPRVLHKYTRLYYPWKLIPPNVEKVNGLNNETLEHLPGFTEASAQALVLFLDLPKPVSLVAHNGNRFDFPVLMAELTKVGCVDKFLDLQCTDSLCAIKHIDDLIKMEESVQSHLMLEWENITETTKLATSFNMDDQDDDFLDGENFCEFNPRKQRKLTESDEERENQVTHSPCQPHESSSHTGRDNQPTVAVSAQSRLTLIEWEDVKEITNLGIYCSIDDLYDDFFDKENFREFNPRKRQRLAESDEERENQVTHSPCQPHESSSHTGRDNQPTVAVSAQSRLTLIEWEDVKEITNLAAYFSIDDLYDDFFDEENFSEEYNPSKRLRSLQPDKERDNRVPHSSGQPLKPTSYTGRGNQPTMEVSAQPLLTPVKSRPPGQTSIPATPSKPAHPPFQYTTPEAPQPGTPRTSNFCTRVTKESSKVRRTLVYDNDSKAKFGGRRPYSQPNIYRRLFDSEYNAHRAESDCEALLAICGHYGSKFVEWADTFATSFLDAKPMWGKLKSFKTNCGAIESFKYL